VGSTGLLFFPISVSLYLPPRDVSRGGGGARAGPFMAAAPTALLPAMPATRPRSRIRHSPGLQTLAAPLLIPFNLLALPVPLPPPWGTAPRSKSIASTKNRGNEEVGEGRGSAGGREEARGPRLPASPPWGCGRAPRLRRRAGDAAAPTSPALCPVVAPCCAKEVLTAMELPYLAALGGNTVDTASSSSPRVAAVHLAHGVFDQMPVPCVERLVKSPMEP
jgi:hypothetical protein